MIKKYVKCFSNGTEAMQWQFANCDRCTRKSVCYARKAIEKGFITGHITRKIVKFIGFKNYSSSTRLTEDDYCRLKDTCDSFNKPIFKMAKLKQVDKNDLTLFNIEDVGYHYELIKCPECNKICNAKVEHNWPWNTYIHDCDCGYIIMESEWNRVNKTKKCKNEHNN